MITSNSSTSSPLHLFCLLQRAEDVASWRRVHLIIVPPGVLRSHSRRAHSHADDLRVIRTHRRLSSSDALSDGKDRKNHHQVCVCVSVCGAYNADRRKTARAASWRRRITAIVPDIQIRGTVVERCVATVCRPVIKTCTAEKEDPFTANRPTDRPGPCST